MDYLPVYIIGFVVLFVVGSSIVILTKLHIEEKKRRKKCTEVVVAEVVDYTEVSIYDRETESYDIKRAPLYEYSYKGEFCRCAGSTSKSWLKKMQIGSKVELFVDPENPKSCICPAEEKHDNIQVIKGLSIGIGVILVIILGIKLFFAYCESI